MITDHIQMEEVKIPTVLNSIFPPTLRETSRDELKQYFENTWEIYEVLFSAIKDDKTYYESPDPLRNPLIFYYGHTAAFYINKLVRSGILKEGINTRYEDIFAKGVDPELPEHLDVLDVWPTMDQVRAYRKKVYDLVQTVIANIDIPNQTTSEHPIWSLHMGLEHDRIHFETSSVLIRQLDASLVEKPASWEYAPTLDKTRETEWVHVDKGTITFGNSEPSELFGWDNEYGKITVDVKPFSATKNLITNGEYLEFIQSGAYNDDQYWLEEALDWKKRTNTFHPKFWVKGGNQYRYRAMFDVMDMPLDWPVEVNAYEARAYCAYKGKEYRLLSEAEFKLITANDYRDVEPALTEGVNLNVDFGSPTPVGYYAQKDDRFNDLYGNVWDWLNDDFYPLPGFAVHPLYTDFSEPYFDDQHSMLLGGAWATSGTGASRFYRLWFRDYFYQHAGFRLAKDA